MSDQRRTVEDMPGKPLPTRPGEGPERRRQADFGKFLLGLLPEVMRFVGEMETDFRHMRRRGKRSCRGHTGSFGHVKGEKGHGTLQLREQVRMLFTTRRELFGCEGQRLVDETGTDELDQTLLL